MGFGRDLGAALTFGLSATTKHKETESKHENRQKQHHRCLNSFNEVQRHNQTNIEGMDAQFAAAQEVLLSTGALTTDVNNNVIYGWFDPEEDIGDVENNQDYARSTIGAIPAFGLGVGTPAVIWTLVGIYGTAATGTAIGALSGAAAGAAIAAWIGRAATLGLGGGMTAGRIALDPSERLPLCSRYPSVLPLPATVKGSTSSKPPMRLRKWPDTRKSSIGVAPECFLCNPEWASLRPICKGTPTNWKRQRRTRRKLRLLSANWTGICEMRQPSRTNWLTS